MLQASTIQLLRFPFSVLLMPVYFFALSFAYPVNWGPAGWLFIIIHALVYPASNGYNSYMDADTQAIGGVENPMQPTRQLYAISLLLDALAVLACLPLGWPIVLGVVGYIVCSRLYSWRGLRLKRFAIPGYLVVVLNQGGLVFALTWAVATGAMPWQVPLLPAVVAVCLIGGFYPITQVYQHQQDAADGVQTLSMLLGVRGTFLFCAAMYALAFGLLGWYLFSHQQGYKWVLLQVFFAPVIFLFASWLFKVWQRPEAANYKATMRMNWTAALCTNLAFIILVILNAIG